MSVGMARKPQKLPDYFTTEEAQALVAAAPSCLNPNPPMDPDGGREDSGRGVRELQAR